MATSSPAPKPSPERIFNTLNAFQQTAALKAGIELDIFFTAIGEGANTAPSLAAKVKAAERGMRILCDYLTIHGFLAKDADRYSLTQESALFLDRRSPACLATMSGFLGAERHKKSFDLLTQAVRKGGAAAGPGDNMQPDDEYWVSFAKSMAPLTVP